MIKPVRKLMELAIAEAKKARGSGEYAIGAVVVKGNRVLAKAQHRTRRDCDPTQHAEMVAIRKASKVLGSRHLDGCVLYTTHEPCPMCAGALVNARVARVVYGCDDPKAGAVRTLYAIGQDARLNHRFELTAGVLGEACSNQLSGFFERVRKSRQSGAT